MRLPYYEQKLDELEESAAIAGIAPSAFWDMSLHEINILTSAFTKKQEADEKRRAIDIYNSAVLTGQAYAAVSPYSKSHKFPQIYEVWPSLFKEQPKPKQQDWRIAKQNLLKYASNHNKKYRGEK